MKKSKRFSLFGITDDGFDLSVVPVQDPTQVTGLEEDEVRSISADELLADIRTIRTLVRDHKEDFGRRIVLIEGLLDRLSYKVAPED